MARATYDNSTGLRNIEDFVKDAGVIDFNTDDLRTIIKQTQKDREELTTTFRDMEFQDPQLLAVELLQNDTESREAYETHNLSYDILRELHLDVFDRTEKMKYVVHNLTPQAEQLMQTCLDPEKLFLILKPNLKNPK